MYNGYGKGEWSFGNHSAKNVRTFRADNSLSYHTDNLKNDFLTLGEGPTIGINPIQDRLFRSC